MKKNSVKVFILLAVTTWISHFLYFKRFGLYEDDYANLPEHFDETFPEIKNFVLSRLEIWLQGRPLSFIPGLLAYIGDEVSEGLSILYVIAFIIVLVNAFLLYKILRKVFPESEIFAVTGAIAFCLFPPDTIKLYLLVVYVLQMSLMYFFFATLLYLNGWKKLSYLVILMCLFSYESPFMVFFAVPLLNKKWNKTLRKEIIIHVGVLCILIGLAFLYRKITGESRVAVASSDLFSVIYKTLAAMILGPLFNLFLFYRAPVVTLMYWFKDQHTVYWWYYNYIIYFVGASLLMFIFYFSKIKSNIFSNSISDSKELIPVSDEENTNAYLGRTAKLSLTGIIMLCLAYALSFTHYPPTAIMGSLTSVHLAANVGGSIIFGCVCTIIFFMADRYRLKKYAVIVLSLYLALLVGYNTYAQKELVVSWEYQRAFWKKILELVPDLNENTVIIMDGYRSPTIFISSHHIYNDMILLGKLFKFPSQWKSHPMLFVVWGDWRESLIQTQNNELIFKSPYLENYVPLKDSSVVIIAANQNNELIRIDSSITLKEKKFILKPKSEPTIDTFRKYKLYDHLIR